ncbi:MAG TPA: maleylpyruvate isomerase N-terminal domain-containing protein [Candidatus Limnocylindrales bacterium]
MMYLNALEFLDEERDAWRPFEALDGLTDDQLARSCPAARGWSGRDLMGHLLAWLENALAVARELAMGEKSPTMSLSDAEWDARGGEAINAELLERFGAIPIAELRSRFRSVPGELRGTLTVVPEARWLKHPDHFRWILDETIDHYADHQSDLDAIVGQAAKAG